MVDQERIAEGTKRERMITIDQEGFAIGQGTIMRKKNCSRPFVQR